MVPPERDRFALRSYVDSSLLTATRPSAAYGSEVARGVEDATLFTDGIAAPEIDGAAALSVDGDAESVAVPSGVAIAAAM